MATIKSMSVEILDGASVARRVKTLSRDAGVKSAIALAKIEGFTLSTKASDAAGFKRTYTPSAPVKEGAVTVTKLAYEYNVHELKRAGSNDLAAVVITRLTPIGAESEAEIDVRYLIAPGGDITKTREMKFDRAAGKMVATNSWWTRLKDCIKGKCSGPCKDALTGCLGSGGIASYLACLAVKCGGCSAKCVACATCRCRWWCKWATGCCRD